MALADIDAAHRDHRRGSEIELFRTEKCGDHHVATIANSAVRPESDPVAEVVDEKGLLSFRQTEFPWRTGMFGGRKRRGTGSAIVAGNQNVIGRSFGDAGGDRSHTGFGDQFDGHFCPWIDFF